MKKKSKYQLLYIQNGKNNFNFFSPPPPPPTMTAAWSLIDIIIMDSFKKSQFQKVKHWKWNNLKSNIKIYIHISMWHF